MGSLVLREQIARQLADAKVKCSAEEIIITSGCQEAISCTLRSICRVNDIVAVESPGFHGVIHILKALGIKVLEVPSDPVHGINLETLEISLSKYKIAAVIVNPTNNNPLGFSMSSERRHRLLKLAIAHDFYIVEDDTYGDLSFSYPRPRAIASFDVCGRVILCGSFSKTLAPGLRIGWVKPGPLYQLILHEKYISSGSSFTAAQKAIAKIMQKGDYQAHLRRMRDRYRQNIAKAKALLEKHFITPYNVTSPVGGYYLWIELPKGVLADDVNRAILDEGVQLASGRVFSVGGDFVSCLRMNCSGNIDYLFEEAVASVSRAVAKLQSKSLTLL
ncbi:aminotransferase-like domain-containing protein [Pseudomonas asuensis]|nr:PLP-dependent aminotransferase family protein [Pseudomonas asuensis]